MSPLDSIRIVLSRPSHPGNIGSVARAMRTMGLHRLVLIQPKHFPDPQATALASGATDVLENALVVETLEEALAPCVMTVACSTRRRELTVPLQTARMLAPQIVAHAAEATSGTVAILFGSEMSGFDNADARRCTHLLAIPADPDFSSLNLAQAVQVVAYELRLAALARASASVSQSESVPTQRGPTAPAHLSAACASETGIDDAGIAHLQEWHSLASHAEIEGFHADLEHSLIALGFLDPQRPRRLIPRLRRLFGRTRLEKNEIDILRGILRACREATCRQLPTDTGIRTTETPSRSAVSSPSPTSPHSLVQ